jgi:hypothetical protein
MYPIPPFPPGLRLTLLAPWLMAAHTPLAAQSGVTSSVVDTGFPHPIGVAVLVIAVCGAIGAFAADLVTDGGRIEQWRRDEAGWSLGFVAKMVIGLVAAIVFLTLNPPGTSWPTLVGSALVAGLGGEAILLAIIASRRAQKAEIEKEQAEEETSRTLDAWVENLRTFESVALAAARTSPVGASTSSEVISDEGWSENAHSSSPLAVVSAYADHAVAEVRRRAERPAV